MYIYIFVYFLASWERADLFALLYVMFACVFVTFSYVVLGQVWFLIVCILDICLLPYSRGARVQKCQK